MSSDVLNVLYDRARASRQRVVLPEGTDPRIIEGGLRAHRDGLATVSFVGPESDVRDLVDGAEVAIHDPASSPLLAELTQVYLDARKHKLPTPEQARAALADPLAFAAILVRAGHADGTIGGAVATTSDTVRAALQGIGRAPGVTSVSSFFLMILPEMPDHPSRPVVFSDCGMVVDPNAETLAGIARASAASYRQLVGQEPHVAMLSFSTAGSASHLDVTKVQEATALVRAAEPDLMVDGEMQFDTAIIPDIAQRKMPESDVAGRADVFIFPDLNSGNIGYKIAQRVGGATAIGPILQGLARPANDLSRGCSAQDVYDLIAVTAIQAQAAV